MCPPIRVLLTLAFAVLGATSCSSGDNGGSACSCPSPQLLVVGSSATYRFQEASVAADTVAVSVLNQPSGTLNPTVYELSIANNGVARVGTVNTESGCCRAPGSPNPTLRLSDEENQIVFANGWGVPGSTENLAQPSPPANPCSDTQFIVQSMTLAARTCQRQVDSIVNGTRASFTVVDVTERAAPTFVGGFLKRTVTRIADGSVVAEGELTGFTQ